MRGRKRGSQQNRSLGSQKVWVPSARRGYEMCVLDSKLSVAARLEILQKLDEKFEPSLQFLARLVRHPATPARLRLAASDILAVVGTPEHRLELAKTKALRRRATAFTKASKSSAETRSEG